ncbi:hypothetical protein [Desulfobacter curvatus]|uniref:hypothetical protein n=1 Tax=Desulfobacter curvatus TaxID=2290 RepID=UPI00037FF658|nr:hypothetical protein [Desulfobacter curvatus]
MKIILHANENDELRSRLKTRIEDNFPESEIVLTDAGPHLSEVLCRPLHNVSVLIAFITDSKSVGLLFSLKPLFENVKLILIYCKRIDEIQKSALLLEPSYIHHSGNNFQDIISVLQRIEQKKLSALSIGMKSNKYGL